MPNVWPVFGSTVAVEHPGGCLSPASYADVVATTVTNLSERKLQTRRRQIQEADASGVPSASANVAKGRKLRAILVAEASAPWVSLGSSEKKMPRP